MGVYDYINKKLIREKILKKYKVLVSDENLWLLGKDLLKIFEKDKDLGLCIISEKWTEKSYQTFLEQNSINFFESKNIAFMKKELFETDIFNYIDLSIVSKSPKLYYDLYKNHDKEKLKSFIQLNIKNNSLNIISNTYLFSKFIDFSISSEQIFNIINNYEELCYEIVDIKNVEIQKKLVDLLDKKKELNCNNIIKFLKKYEIEEINDVYFSILANIDDIKKIDTLLEENDELLNKFKTQKNIEHTYEIDSELYDLYFNVVPISELENKSNELYKEKISYLLFGCRINYIKVRWSEAWQEIYSVASVNKNEELLETMKIFNNLIYLYTKKELSEFYLKYKDIKVLKKDEFHTQLLKTYSEKLNNGLFNPNNISDEVGIHGNYEVTYIPYKDKEIKKIIVRDPNFYMDVTNILNWSGNSVKDKKIIELSQKVINNPKTYSIIQDGSTTVCTTLINRNQMRTFSIPIVTGGFSKIDYQRLILAKNGDAGTPDRLKQGTVISFESINNMLSSSSLVKNGYNEVTYHRHYYADGEWKSQEFDYMVICPNSKWGHEKIEPTLEWAYVFDIPVVEIDSKFMYNYSEKELEELVLQLYHSSDKITFLDLEKIINLFSSLNSFLPEGEFTKYCFTEIMDYVINWEHKKYTYENLEELEKIFNYIDKGNNFGNQNIFLNEDIKYNSEEIDKKDELFNIKAKEKQEWLKNWINLIKKEKEKLLENHKSL